MKRWTSNRPGEMSPWPHCLKNEWNEVKMSQETDCSTETSCAACESSGTCDSATQELHMQSQLSQRLSPIKHRIVGMSGKGGVGKATVAVNLAQRPQH
jgi:Mrp family chromosome partitioning ATPase